MNQRAREREMGSIALSQGKLSPTQLMRRDRIYSQLLHCMLLTVHRKEHHKYYTSAKAAQNVWVILTRIFVALNN